MSCVPVPHASGAPLEILVITPLPRHEVLQANVQQQTRFEMIIIYYSPLVLVSHVPKRSSSLGGDASPGTFEFKGPPISFPPVVQRSSCPCFKCP